MKIQLILTAVLALSCATTPTAPVSDTTAETPQPARAEPPATEEAPARPTAEDARAFVQQVDAKLKDLFYRVGTAEWIRATHITEDTVRNAAWNGENLLRYLNEVNKEAVKFRGVEGIDPATARQLKLLRLSAALPSPNDPQKRAELAGLAANLDSMYGEGKYCKGNDPKSCRDLEQLSELMRTSRSYEELLDAWQGWHSISVPMRPMYARLVELGNEGARELDFQNLGDLWKSNYDMPPAEFEQEVERLWGQVKPFYDQLHCYVRGQLAKQYKGQVQAEGPIPAHLLGNMWAQEWGNVYPTMVPFPGQGNPDVTAEIQRRKWDALKMVQVGEGFFTSMGLRPLPETFWKRSMFTKPRDREVVCHASAWDVSYAGDIRIKMCIKPIEEDFQTIHHELGHNYYYQYYFDEPVLFQQGAHDGFHEAIGDAVALSITPPYLKAVGLFDKVPAKNEKATVNTLFKEALDKIAFLPFARMIDQWRYDVFAGKVSPEQYTAHWEALRLKYQGIKSPVERPANSFDPGAKYHIPGNTPYTRYFLARILQFQFQKAMCDAAGFKGPLHECSVYGNKEAGARLAAMLEMGASQPWPDAMEKLTGTRKMDASALVEYFQPLRGWLDSQTKGMKCGW